MKINNLKKKNFFQIYNNKPCKISQIIKKITWLIIYNNIVKMQNIIIKGEFFSYFLYKKISQTFLFSIINTKQIINGNILKRN